MRESELLAHIALRSQNVGQRFPYVLVGPGDDCAVVRTPNGDQLLLTTDHLVEGRHFEPLDLTTERGMLDLVARKAIARSVSDIAAMGGTPMCALATACLPPGFPQDAANELFDCMQRWGEHWSAPLVGGDLSSTSAQRLGPLVLTTTVLGTPHKYGAVLRSGAVVNDGIYVTGTLGGSRRDHRHLRFEPRLRDGKWLLDTYRPGSNGVHAMMDLSDGLGRDAARMGRASGALFEVDSGLLPLSPGSDWRAALSDGEDYELLFTVDHVGSGIQGLPATCPTTGTRLTRIGTVRQATGIGDKPEPGKENLPFSGCIVKTPDGAWIDASELGWEHT